MRERLPAAVAVHGLAVVVLATGAALALLAPTSYYRLVQEDELLEWATFWAFALAGALHVLAALRDERTVRATWFGLGVGLFCWFVALEEISWGQRVLGFRPPEYFLDRNFQQELNLHNLVGRIARKAALVGVIGGYGVALPLAARWRRTRSSVERLGLHAPPLALAPLFGLVLLLQVVYPIRFTGEWVELLLGLGFLVAPVLASRADGRALVPAKHPLGAVALLTVALLGLGALSAAWSRHLRAVSPEAVRAATLELRVLSEDIADIPLPDREHGHARLHSFVGEHGWTGLERGRFQALVAQGLPEERAAYQLDPWNGPYWLRYERRDDGSDRRLLYSLGPNRIRETVGWTLGGDDLGLELPRAAPSSD